MDVIYEQELTVAIAALQSASKLSQLIVSSVDKGVTQKQDLSVVTIADFAVQALLITTFKNAFPNDSFVGEEDASALRTNAALMEHVWELLGRVAEDDETRSLACTLPSTRGQMCELIDLAGNGRPGGPGSGRVWVFDPIDGTQNYVRGDLYAINIGLLIDGEQVIGVVGCPNMALNPESPLTNQDVDLSGNGCILYAVKGHGAFIRPMHWGITSEPPSPRRLEPHRSDLGLGDLCSVTCVGLVDSALDGVHGVVAERLGMPFPGSNLVPWVLRWVALAMGLANTTVWVYKRMDRYAKVWDHAGAMLLFEETGGKVTDVRGRAMDWTAGRQMRSNVGFVAAPSGIHGHVLDAVRAVLKDQGRCEYLRDNR